MRRRYALLLAAVVLPWGTPALAAGGSYASDGHFNQSLWWLDFTSFSTASTAAQPLSFSLPGGGGTLALTATESSTGMAMVAEPSWTGGGAFGHGAYDGITGKPIFYWLNQTGTGSVTLSSIKVTDAAGNARNFVLNAADGENTNSPESITYTSTANWTLIDTVNNYASFNGGVPTLSGLGTTSVVETAPASNDNNYNASVVLGTANPTQVSTTFSGNEASPFAVSLPPVTFNLVVAGRISASDQFTVSMAYTSPAASLASASSSGTGTTAGTGTIDVIGTNSITLSAAMVAGSPSTLAQYAGNMSCSNAGPGAASWGGTNTALPAGTGTSFALTPQTGDNITCTLTLTPRNVAGTVYNDANHNGVQDNGEGATGVAGLYVKLVPYTGGTCQGPASAAAAVTAGTGAYSFTGVSAGSYCLILNGDNTLSDITETPPAAWIGTQNSSGVIGLTVPPGGAAPPENFGLYNGSTLSGTVFADTGAGGGTANNGVKDGAEAGTPAVVVQATAGAATVASGTTAGNGTYTLWIPASVSGTVTVAPTLPSGDLATGGSAGTTGGSYSRPSVSYTAASGQSYSGVSFGAVPPNTLGPNGAQTAQPGTTAFYAHSFLAGSGGQLTLSLAGTATPSTPAWTQALYQDTNCTGTFASGDPQISAPLTVTAGQKVCLIVEQFVPAGAAGGAQDSLTLSAAFQYTNANPALAATVMASDATTVGQPGALGLTKLVSNVTQGGAAATAVNANPGDTLQYTVTATNNGTQPLTTIVINDATPAFTTFVSAACPATLPAGITACSVSTKPAVGASGALQWTFTGSLAAGAPLAVTYQVKVSS
ncbi:MAG: SdrD B-like domain-containing protein [Steroidobacteraceae bacterium]